MGKKFKKVTEQKQFESKKSASQADSNQLNIGHLLGDDTLNKLKAAAQTMKQQAEAEKQKKAEAEETKRKEEQKRLENDFAYLLENSDPRAHKYK